MNHATPTEGRSIGGQHYQVMQNNDGKYHCYQWTQGESWHWHGFGIGHESRDEAWRACHVDAARDAWEDNDWVAVCGIHGETVFCTTHDEAEAVATAWATDNGHRMELDSTRDRMGIEVMQIADYIRDMESDT